MSHPYLATFGICFNVFLGLIICLECGCALGTKSIVLHLHDVHQEEHFRIDHTKLNQVLTELQVKESFDLTNLPINCPEIEGLHLSSNAYICFTCQHIRGTLKSIQTHHLACHPNIPMPTSWKRVAAQQLHHQNRTSYFQVIPRNLPSNENDIATQFFISLNQN